jgi:hypothetical protein
VPPSEGHKVQPWALLDVQMRQEIERAEAGGAWTETGLVFTSDDGRAYLAAYVSRTFDRLAREAGMPRLTMHGSDISMRALCCRPGRPLRS